MWRLSYLSKSGLGMGEKDNNYPDIGAINPGAKNLLFR
jgi:hypothetical protein